MKYLSHYIEDAQTEQLDNHGAFFAFGLKTRHAENQTRRKHGK